MTKFEVKIIETSSRIVEIDANSIEEAIAMAETLYHEEEVVLDYSDFDQVEFETLNN